MADDGNRGLAPIIRTPGTSLTAGLTVPAGKEWTVRLARATNIAAADATVTVSIGAAGEIAFNFPVKVAQSANVLGPDFIVLPAGTVLQDRASAVSAIRLVYFVTERDVA